MTAIPPDDEPLTALERGLFALIGILSAAMLAAFVVHLLGGRHA